MPMAVREDAQVVSVARDGRIFYRNTLIAVDELPDRIRESIKNGADRKVYVRADARARYGGIQRGLDEISKTGIWDVCFFSESGFAVDFSFPFFGGGHILGGGVYEFFVVRMLWDLG